MANEPNVTDIKYNENKNYISTRVQKNSAIEDWVLNSFFKELEYLFIEYGKLLGDGLLNKGNRIQLDAPSAGYTNDFSITEGIAIINGRIITIRDNFLYSNYQLNYILKGSITSVVELVATTKYKVFDSEKLLTDDYPIATGRILFTSGALSGQYFDVESIDGQGVIINGDLSSVVATDDYYLLPPEITTPTVDITVPVYLITWSEDISSVEDTNIASSYASSNDPIHKIQRRYVFYYGEYNHANTDDNLNGFSSIKVGELIRNNGGSNINPAVIQNIDPIYSLEDAYSILSSSLSSINNTTSIIQKQDYRFSPHYNNHNIVLNDSIYTSNFMELISDRLDNGDVILSHNKTLLNNQCHLNLKSGSVTLDTDNSLDIDDVCIETIKSNSSGQANVIRSLPLIGQDYQRGFNWIVKEVDNNIYINPGMCFRWGNYYQLSDIVQLDSNSISSYRLNALPSSGLFNYIPVYIYLKVEDDKRSLVPIIDVQGPKWNGEHKLIKAFIIGMTYFDINNSRCVASYCRNNKVYIDLEAREAENGTDSGIVSRPLFNNFERIKEVDEYEFQCESIWDEGLQVQLAVYSQDSYSNSEGSVCNIYFNGGTLNTYNVNLPNRDNIYYSSSTFTSSGTNRFSVRLKSFTFNPINICDNSFWR